MSLNGIKALTFDVIVEDFPALASELGLNHSD